MSGGPVQAPARFLEAPAEDPGCPVEFVYHRPDRTLVLEGHVVEAAFRRKGGKLPSEGEEPSVFTQSAAFGAAEHAMPTHRVRFQAHRVMSFFVLATLAVACQSVDPRDPAEERI